MHEMKRLLISLIAFSGPFYLGCRQEGTKEPPPANTDLVRTENGTIIKKTGWQLPTTLPDEKRYTATTVIIEGRAVKVLNSPFLPQGKLPVTIPKLREDGDAVYNVYQIIEFVDERKKPYCYQLFGSDVAYDASNIPPGGTTIFSYRDDDGDGIFETLGAGCSVPAWVK